MAEVGNAAHWISCIGTLASRREIRTSASSPFAAPPLALDGDLRTGTATSMEHGVVEPIQIRVAFDRRLARLAEHVPEEGVALFGNPAQPVFARRGLDRRGQPYVAHHVLARGEAGHGP